MIWVLGVKTGFTNCQMDPLVAIYNDITERKKAENELGQSEAKFKELTSLLPEMVFEIDNRGNITFANLQSL